MKSRSGPWLALAIVVGVAIRAALLPTNGYADDLTQFVEWVRHIANNGLPNAYDAPLSFGPVMAFVWAIIGAIDPAFRTATDASDLGVRILLKLPGTLADFGLAAGVWYALRARPAWAAAGAAVILLHPAIWFVSAWWGQYESIFALLVLLAYLAATAGRDTLAVVALTAALLTKPQVAPLVVPFAAWFLARIGWRSLASIARLVILALVALGTTAVLWLPFIAAGGPANYLANLATYQNGPYSVLSLNAWNLWWLVQELFAGGSLVGDNQSFLGPLTFRLAGFGLAGLLLLLIGHGVYRRPTAQTLALGLAAAALVAFAFLTTMHERYAYAAVVFLALLIDDRRARWIALVLGIVFILNLVAAASAAAYLPKVVDITGVAGFLGPLAMIGVTLLVVREVSRPHAQQSAS
jgi:Gpi18-like mannosyltransferase